MSGIITTIAGNGDNNFYGDGGLAVDASMNHPQGTGLGYNQSLYIADVPNQRVRRIHPSPPSPTITEIELSATPELPCIGSNVTFNASVINAGEHQQYQWFVNENPVGNSIGSFSSTSLAEGDIVKCIFTSEHCTGTETITSNEIEVHYGSGEAPTVSIRSTASKVCPGESITLTTLVENGVDVTYQWFKNDNAVGDGSAEFTYVPVDADDFIRCEISSRGCAGGAYEHGTVNAGAYTVPQVTIAPREISVTPGTVVQLTANVSGELNNFSWISAEPLSNNNSLSTATAPVTNSHDVIFVGETTDGCVIKDTVNISVFIQMMMPNAFTPNSDGNNDIFRIPPGVKFSLKEFAIFDRWGKKIFATADVTKGWTGENARNGTYVYSVTGEIDGRKTIFKGHRSIEQVNVSQNYFNCPFFVVITPPCYPGTFSYL